jgi:hypothetical protein
MRRRIEKGHWKNGYDTETIVRKPAVLDLYTRKRILLFVHKLVITVPEILERCPEVVDGPLPSTHPFYIQAPIFRNCALVACHFGPFEVEEVAIMLNEDKETIYNIQKSAMNKLKKYFDSKCEKDDYL